MVNYSMNTPKVSIVIPIYNSEKYISKCLDSLLKQTIDSYEIICIDDGSTDSTPDILEKYSNLYNNIKVFHIKNSGVWAARKYGISKCTGMYIGFCDSDDTVEPEMYDTLFKLAKTSSAQISVTAYKRIDITTNKVYSVEMKSFGNRIIDVNSDTGYLAMINASLWNKLFLSSCLKMVVDFDTPPRIAEDMMFLLSIYPSVERIAFVDIPMYNYYVRSNSAIQTINLKDIDITQNAMIHTKNHILQWNSSEKFITLIDLMAFIHLGISLNFGALANNANNFSYVNKKIINCMDEHFPSWKHNRYLSLSYNLHNKFLLLKPSIVALVFKLKLILPFAKLYNFMIYKMKIVIKW